MEKEIDKNFQDTIWQLFETTGQIGYYNLFRALEEGADDVQ